MDFKFLSSLSSSSNVMDKFSSSSLPTLNGSSANTQQSGFSKLVTDFENEITLSYRNRILFFILTLGAGLFCCIASTWFLIFPRVFAKWYTIGSVLILASTFFFEGTNYTT